MILLDCSLHLQIVWIVTLAVSSTSVVSSSWTVFIWFNTLIHPVHFNLPVNLLFHCVKQSHDNRFYLVNLWSKQHIRYYEHMYLQKINKWLMRIQTWAQFRQSKICQRWIPCSVSWSCHKKAIKRTRATTHVLDSKNFIIKFHNARGHTLYRQFIVVAHVHFVK